jgi:serine/threonine protein kinase
MELKTLSRFEILRLLGKWELGRVFKGVDPKSSRWVALRDIRSDASRPESELRVHRVVDTASKARILDSANIVRLQEIGEVDGVFFLVTEYVEGTTLQSLLAQKTEFSALDLTDITRQVCLAIDHAHSRGVVHSNLCPANLMQEWDGNIKVMDYGVASNVLERIQGTAVPEAIHYLSPEQVQGQSYDLRSNLFSWGAILYEMFVGEKAFPGADAKTVLDKIVSASPVFPQAKISRNPGLCQVILKAISKAPKDRYQNGSDFVSAMEHCAKPAPTVLTRSEVAPAASAIQPAPACPPVTENASGPGAAPVVAEPASAAPKTIARSAGSTPASQFIVVPARSSTPEKAVSAAPVKEPSRPVSKRSLLMAMAAVLLLAFGAVFGYTVYSRHRAEIVQATPAVVEAPQPVTQVPIPQETGSEVRAAENENTHEEVVERPEVKPAARSKPVLTAELTVNSFPEGAQIQLNGSTISGLTPHTLTGLAEGEYAITVSKPGYTSGTRTVRVKGGEPATLVLQLSEALATVAFSSDPQSASVFVDGKDVGRVTPISVRMSKGTHTLTITKQGYFEASNRLELTPGQNYQYSPRLVPMGRAEDVRPAGKFKMFGGGGASEMARVEIRTNPRGAQITVNQKPMEKVSPAEFLFPTGIYEVTLTAPGYKPLRKTINVVQGSKFVIDETLQKTGM